MSKSKVFSSKAAEASEAFRVRPASQFVVTESSKQSEGGAEVRSDGWFGGLKLAGDFCKFCFWGLLVMFFLVVGSVVYINIWFVGEAEFFGKLPVRKIKDQKSVLWRPFV